MDNELWRPVPGFGGYEASDLGRVRSVDREILTSNGRRVFCRGRLLTNQLTPGGYYTVSVGHDRMALVHRLVAFAFIPNTEAKPYVNHIDNNPGNNAVSNLEWVTQSENLHHAGALGLMARTALRGTNHPGHKLTSAQVAELRRLAGTISNRKLAARFGVASTTVDRILSGKLRAYDQ